ncbi:sushi nidogen and EGF-like domain-containing protein 1 [Biomphalaria pfeifferi]|uniref:Sushi nidogen and EGF-like domain-containing protein 1 n=1 Tax=Biomphalaria pfeifferi TaxID=112525 RepID=A0AAD8EZ50_BIOPF|nr:sushi nidogen and EGF-like domain-containing protein 1 [Biomphalaria pfeifferi]
MSKYSTVHFLLVLTVTIFGAAKAQVECPGGCPEGQVCELRPFPCPPGRFCIQIVVPTCVPPPDNCGGQCHEGEVCIDTGIRCVRAPCNEAFKCVPNNKCGGCRPDQECRAVKACERPDPCITTFLCLPRTGY